MLTHFRFELALDHSRGALFRHLSNALGGNAAVLPKPVVNGVRCTDDVAEAGQPAVGWEVLGVRVPRPEALESHLLRHAESESTPFRCRSDIMCEKYVMELRCVACDLSENELCHLIFGFVAGAAGVDDLRLLVETLLHIFAQDFAQGTVVLVPHVSVLHHRCPGHEFIFSPRARTKINNPVMKYYIFSVDYQKVENIFHIFRFPNLKDYDFFN